MIGALLGVFAVVFAVATLTPSTADALVYPGESAVETIPGGGVGDELTGPAKSILENPTFIAEEVSDAALAGGASEASGVASIFEGAGLIPGVGLAIGTFTAGVGIGSIICNSVFELEGCLKLSSTGANTAPGTGSWSWQQTGCDNTMPDYAWYYQTPEPSSAHCNVAFFNIGGNKETCGFKPPAGGGTYFSEAAHLHETCGTGPEAGKYEYSKGALVKDSMANRQFQAMTKAEAAGSGLPSYAGTGYCPAEAPTTCTKTPSTNWAERVARILHNGTTGVSEATRNKVGESIAAEIPGSGVQSPYKTYVEVPECSGEAWIGCKEQLEELHLVPKRQEVNWSEVETDVPNEVLTLSPSPQTQVVTKSTVTVVTNPGADGMPLVVPRPGSAETYTEYISRLAPGLNPHRQVVRDSEIDSSAGPAGVLGVQPQPGTKLNPAVSHEVNVGTNPDVVPGGGVWSPPAIPAIDMSPLSGLSPCGVFPFGLFCWVGEALGQFNTTGVCPHTSVPIGGGNDFDLTLCGESAETILSYLRPVLLFAFVVGCGFLFARGTKAIGDD